MELSFLQEFVVLAEIQKFSAAAQKLHISQSTLSRHIQALEAELGCALFERTTREMALSACGTLYLPFAKRIVQTADDGTAQLKEYLRQQSQTVCIGVVHDPDLYQVIDYLMDFQKKEPLFPLNVIEGRKRKTIFCTGTLPIF